MRISPHTAQSSAFLTVGDSKAPGGYPGWCITHQKEISGGYAGWRPAFFPLSEIEREKGRSRVPHREHVSPRALNLQGGLNKLPILYLDMQHTRLYFFDVTHLHLFYHITIDIMLTSITYIC